MRENLVCWCDVVAFRGESHRSAVATESAPAIRGSAMAEIQVSSDDTTAASGLTTLLIACAARRAGAQPAGR